MEVERNTFPLLSCSTDACLLFFPLFLCVPHLIHRSELLFLVFTDKILYFSDNTVWQHMNEKRRRGRGRVKKRLNGARRGWKKKWEFYKDFSSPARLLRTFLPHVWAFSLLVARVTSFSNNIEHSNIFHVLCERRSFVGEMWKGSGRNFSNIYQLSFFSSSLRFISIILKSNANNF